jgi:Leucine-rich repeat (LRR) protein
VFYRQENKQDADWQELDRGPGYFRIPPDHEVRIQPKSASHSELQTLAEEINGVEAITSLDLSENRNITDSGIARLKNLSHLRELKLSSCDITYKAIDHLAELPNLKSLDLSYCNRIHDSSIKGLNALSQLEYLDLQACMQVTRAGIKRLERRGLEIHR